MVKPLNKEWELFGPKYRVAGAKGDKVNCNACQKQVSAAVNRLQSHLRVCPARPALATVMDENADALLKQQLKQQQQQHPDAFGGQCADTSHAMAVEDNHHHADSIGDGADLTAAALDSNGGAAFSAASQTFLSTGSAPQTAAGGGAAVVMVSAEPDTGAGATISTAPVESAHLIVPAPGMAAAATAVTGTTAPSTGAPATKRHKTSPTRTKERPRWSNTSTTVSSASSSAAIAAMDDFWLGGTSQQSSSSSLSASSSAYAKRRLELEEKRLLLEIKKDQREERRELYHLEILEAQARKERLATDKEAYEGKVLLALSRKQLRDQGVSEDEIDRILPVENNSNTVTGAAATAKSYATPVVDTENES